MRGKGERGDEVMVVEGGTGGAFAGWGLRCI